MACYVVSYDLRSPGQNYDGLYKELRRIGAVKALESVWFVAVNQSATPLRDALLSYMDRNDGLMVVEITNDADWAVAGFYPAPIAWLRTWTP